MTDRTQLPDADYQEQHAPAGPEGERDPLERIVVDVNKPEADALEQDTPAAPQPERHLVSGRSARGELIPEADAQEQATPADREIVDEYD